MHIKHKNETKPSIELLNKRYKYNPDTGELIRMPRERGEFPTQASWRSFMSRLAGKPVTKKSRGYLVVCIAVDGVSKYCMAHRAIWAMVHGEWPGSDIDHINRNRTDNTLRNLRLAGDLENAQNKDICDRNRSGFKGVHWLPENKKWRAQIKFNGKSRHLGCFESAVDAATAYRTEALKLQGEYSVFAKGNL